MNTLDFNFFDGFIKIVAGEVYYNFNYLVKQSHYPNTVYCRRRLYHINYLVVQFHGPTTTKLFVYF
jgi:hypothetical protein